jgi:hypothetical protein
MLTLQESEGMLPQLAFAGHLHQHHQLSLSITSANERWRRQMAEQAFKAEWPAAAPARSG